MTVHVGDRTCKSDLLQKENFGGKQVNFTLEQATKAQRVSRGIALLFL